MRTRTKVEEIYDHGSDERSVEEKTSRRTGYTGKIPLVYNISDNEQNTQDHAREGEGTGEFALFVTLRYEWEKEEPQTKPEQK